MSTNQTKNKFPSLLLVCLFDTKKSKDHGCLLPLGERQQVKCEGSMWQVGTHVYLQTGVYVCFLHCASVTITWWKSIMNGYHFLTLQCKIFFILAQWKPPIFMKMQVAIQEENHRRSHGSPLLSVCNHCFVFRLPTPSAAPPARNP